MYVKFYTDPFNISNLALRRVTDVISGTKNFSDESILRELFLITHQLVKYEEYKKIYEQVAKLNQENPSKLKFEISFETFNQQKANDHFLFYFGCSSFVAFNTLYKEHFEEKNKNFAKKKSSFEDQYQKNISLFFLEELMYFFFFFLLFFFLFFFFLFFFKN